MHWRLYIFFLSATAAFCFMLLTAVTDYGSSGNYQPPLVSATVPDEGGAERFRVAPASAVAPRPALHTDPLLKPNTPLLFVPRTADPLALTAARDEPHRGHTDHRLRWDEGGWYREEIALTTAYCPCSKCCGTGSPGITSIGKNAWTPGLAADPLYLDYGTRVFVPGYGLSVIDDTGGAMRRQWRRNGQLHIDVRMTYHYEARQWGKQYLPVKIYVRE